MLHFLRRSTLFFMLLALAVAWIGCTKRIPPVQMVNIPDANLRTAIEDALHKPAGAIITNADMATLTSLGGDRANIRELTGLEFATNLISLHLRSTSAIGPITPCRTNKSETSRYQREWCNKSLAPRRINKPRVP